VAGNNISFNNTLGDQTFEQHDLTLTAAPAAPSRSAAMSLQHAAAQEHHNHQRREHQQHLVRRHLCRQLLGDGQRQPDGWRPDRHRLRQ